MSKRFYPQHPGERKKARLDISISDHNFPLSQNPSTSKDVNADNWGDDNDDEILLLASQACEQAYPTNEISALPDYSICMKPSTTSTQMFQDPAPSTSKSAFAFKKPSHHSPLSLSTHLKDKCGTISSPLPGITTKMSTENNFDDDDFIFNDKVYKGQDSDFVYRQLLQLKEENAKLKSENCKLSEKCVTKDGEVSILRTQLKGTQTAVDNARLERMKAQEKVQMEWNDKLSAANNQAQDLRTQLDFKNLEIISIKEKCKRLESSKVKLTQVTVAGNDVSSSNRNHSTYLHEFPPSARKSKLASCSVQTDLYAHYIKLNKTSRIAQASIDKYLPYIMEQTTISQNVICNNEKLHKNMNTSHNRCRTISNFHRVPSTPFCKGRKRLKFNINCIYEDLMNVFGCQRITDVTSQYFHILDKVKDILTDLENQLEFISKRGTTAFQREMDEKYMDNTNEYKVVYIEDLVSGKLLHKDEQGVLARRVTAILALMLESNMDLFIQYQQIKQDNTYIDILCKICKLLESSSCATLYSGVLQSIINVTLQVLNHSTYHCKLKLIVKNLIFSRPICHVSCQTLKLLARMALVIDLSELCPNSNTGNLKTDYEQGVLLYKKDSCTLQVLLKQIETAVKCVEKQSLRRQIVEVTQDLLDLYNNSCFNTLHVAGKSRCECRQYLLQVIVYSLNVCADCLQKDNGLDSDEPLDSVSLSVCRSGIRLLYQGVIRDAEMFSLSLAHHEGHFIQFAETMKAYTHGEVYGNMLTELTSTFQAGVEDTPPSYHRQAWMKSFRSLSMVD